MRTIVALLLLLARAAQAEPLTISGTTMGTTYHIKVADAESAAAGGESELRTDVEEVLAEVDRQMSTWRRDSEVSQFNRAPADEWFAVSSASAEVVAAAQEISQKTDGALDVTVGPLVRLWHFGPDATPSDGEAQPRPFGPPTDAVITKARKLVGYEKLQVRLSPPALRKSVAGVEIDLSSIAPGYAIDQIGKRLTERGLINWLVEIGGEVRAAGRRVDGSAWKVAVRRPVAGKPQMQSVVPLVDAAIATAGNYEKFFEHGGRKYSHIIDATTGRPVSHFLASVTVVAKKCIDADGWDTPLLVLGAERGFECAEKNGVAALLMSRDDDGVTMRETTAWRKQFGSTRIPNDR